MARIFRFVDEGPPKVTLLDLENTSGTGFRLGRGFNLGGAEVDATWLSQKPNDGAIQAGSRLDTVMMTIPLILPRQSTWAAVAALMQALGTQLNKPHNVIEFRPDGAGASYFIDTYRARIPTLFHGQDAPAIENLRFDPEPIVLFIPRYPTLRGAGSFV